MTVGAASDRMSLRRRPVMTRREVVAPKKAAKPAKKPKVAKPASEGEPEARVLDQRYALEPVTKLRVHPKNARRGNVDLISESVVENGFFGAVVAQLSTGYVLVGNHRYTSAVAKGITSIPTLWIDVDDVRARKIAMADNKASDAAGYDDAAVLAALKEFGPENLAGTLWQEEEMVRLMAKLEPPQAFPEFDETVTVTKCCPKCGFKWS